ncbi:YbaN family protein [Halobacillus sp. Nhm2S1]|uniref:YbaN family protein n=1 Tax=Halobacillus sp. Nhm2S1 TaxID=2866716 RepID=UPI001C735F65|nr:YbaN family protein [Halobacillus sp. Nhm2S1]MBX0359505.1 YbaN family protein [Halobacillus sp. Nhm2S1]
MKQMVRVLLIVIGSISLVLGVLGIVLPLVPTTPFLLLTGACYVRSSDRLYNWLMSNKWFGSYIKNYKAGRGIPVRAKVSLLIMIWFSFLFSAFYITSYPLLRAGFVFGGFFFTFLILRTKTYQPENDQL